MARAYRMTSARRAAIKKAQAASARKRRGKHKRRIAIGVGAAGLGVIGVTMAASMAKGKKRRHAPQNVVQATLPQKAPAIKLSTSKEIDIIRNTIDDTVTVDRRGRVKIDYSRVGAASSQTRATVIDLKKEQKKKKLGKETKSKHKIRVSSSGVAIRVRRNRPGFNDSRRADYKPSSRRLRYAQEKARGAKWLTQEHRAAKRAAKAKRNNNG